MKNIFYMIISSILCVSLLISGCGIVESKKSEAIINSWEFSSNPTVELVKIAEKTSKAKVLAIAEKYYKLTFSKIESDLKQEFNKNMTWSPKFDGTVVKSKLPSECSMKLATAITYTNAKNYYLALASSVFARTPESVNAASNFATAIATYCDDVQIEGNITESKKNEFYLDAVSVYYYTISISSTKKYGEEHLVALTCLGNVFLDIKKFDEAYAAFKGALKVDKTYNPARTGLYNYYIATKQHQKALELLLAGAEYMPMFAKAVKKVTEKTEIKQDQIPEDATVKELETILDGLTNIPEVTVADFIDEIDSKTAAKIRKDMVTLKTEMTFKAPNIDILIDKHISFEQMTKAPALATLEVFANELISSQSKTLPSETEDLIQNQLEVLDQFGADVDLGFDSDKINEIIQDAIKNPEKYENWEPDMDISGISNVTDDAANPEYKVLLLNPYDYLNSRDVIVQRFNISTLINKMTAYKTFWAKLLYEYGIADSITEYTEKSTPVLTEFYKKLGDIMQSDMTENEKKIKSHKLHVQYYPKLNEITKPHWAEATSKAAIRYKKIEKYAPKMYSDCMKHIMLISDFEVREKLENELKQLINQNINGGIQQVITAYTFAKHNDIEQCGCDPDVIRDLENEVEKQKSVLAKERAKELEKQKMDKKNFDNMVLDENSKFYKEKIAKYEYEVDFIFLKYKSNPYKSLTQCKFDFKVGNANGSILENHYRNTTTFDGNLELGGELKSGNTKVSIKGGFGFTATRQSDGNFYPEDIDVRAKLEAETNVADIINVKSGIEGSALRGTKFYSELSVTEESLPIDVSKKIWDGEYVIK